VDLGGRRPFSGLITGGGCRPVFIMSSFDKEGLNFLASAAFSAGLLAVNKNLNPQYLWWFASAIYPTQPFSWLFAGCRWIESPGYPIFYTTLIEDFYQSNQSYWVYYLLVLRNLGIGYLTWLILKTWYSSWSRIKGKRFAK
jgi:hypothetical protein